MTSQSQQKYEEFREHTTSHECSALRCKTARNLYNSYWRAKTKQDVLSDPEHKAHGTVQGKKIFGCNCDACLIAYETKRPVINAAKRKYELKKKAATPVIPKQRQKKAKPTPVGHMVIPSFVLRSVEDKSYLLDIAKVNFLVGDDDTVADMLGIGEGNLYSGQVISHNPYKGDRRHLPREQYEVVKKIRERFKNEYL